MGKIVKIKSTLIALATLLMVACGGGGSSSSSDTGQISGKVLNASSGAPVSSARVSAGSQSTTTAADGSYTLSSVNIADRVVVTVATDGFADQSKIVYLTSQDPDANLTVTVLPIGLTQTFDPAVAQTLTVAGSTASVMLDAGTLKKEDGSDPTGSVTTNLTIVDPSVDIDLMPGDLLTDSGAGELQQIESFGAIIVTFKDDDGNDLNLAGGETATIRIPVPVSADSPPASIPLYFYDESSGLWVEEGSANLVNGISGRYYQGSVGHFSVWNADIVYDRVLINGCVENSSGAPIVSTGVLALGKDYFGVAFAFTDSTGRFSVYAKQNATVNVYSVNAAGITNTVMVETADSDITLTSCLVVEATNTDPIVNAGIDQLVVEGDVVQFAGSGSDAEGSVTFSWTQTVGPTVTLSDTAIADPTFTAPEVTSQQNLEFILTVTDADNVSVTDTVVITVGDSIINNPPVVEAGPDQNVDEGDFVQLAGSGSDNEGSVTFSWTQTAGTTVTLSNAGIPDPTFMAPQLSTTEILEFTLTVTDQTNVSVTDTVSITVNDVPVNTPPEAEAGPDQNVDEGDVVQLAGSGSDAEGVVQLRWTQITGAAATLSNTGIPNPTFTAPLVGSTEVLQFRLTVTDLANVSVTDTVNITVNDVPTNTLPIADAGPDQTRSEGATVQLAGSGSDNEGAVTYSWTQNSGTTVVLSSTTIADPTFTAPQVNSNEILSFTLTVTDTDSATKQDSVIITVTDTGGGGGGGGGGSATETYLFYNNDLNAVDPANPGSPILIEQSANIVSGSFGFSSSVEAIRTGTYDSVTKTVSDIHTFAVLYAKTDGKFYKVSALKTGSLTPVQVSSESQADLLCVGSLNGSAGNLDLADVNNSQYLYSLPGSDNSCGTNDDVWKMIRLGMASGTAPVVAKKPVSDIVNVTTGAISGWLVHDQGKLKRCDENFANCTDIVSVSSSADLELTVTSDDYVLEIDDQLYTYNVTSNTLSSALYTIASGTFNTVLYSDGNMVYFGNGTLLYEFPVDGSSVATVLATETNDVQQVSLTANKVIYQVGAGGIGVELKAIAKTGGSASSLAAVTGADDLLLLFTTSNYIYYNTRTTVSSVGSIEYIPVAAGVIDESGANKTEVAKAAWSGTTIGNSYDLTSVLSLSMLVETLQLAVGYDIAGTAGGYAGATIKAVDANTAVTGATLGTLPVADKITNMFCLGVADKALCGALLTIDPAPVLPALPFNNDIFYIDNQINNSLTRVTNTEDKLEIPL